MSTLLEQASLVLIPSGYKEDVVYSQIPTNGNGDLSFTRASNGTRVNSAGLVEVCPWNLAQYSEDLSNAVWDKNAGGVLVTANATTAPNGTTTADQVENNPSSPNSPWMLQFFTNLIGGQTYTYSVYAKASTSGTKQLGIWNNSSAGTYQNINVTTEWQRFEFSFVANASATQWAIGLEFNGAETAYFLWGCQLNIGTTAKPYFPTTDRLNVPRLTYQNGGGGCPSLLLEKQSTNLAIESEQLNLWNGANASVTANTSVSPDGTQNADNVNITATNGYWRRNPLTFANSTSYTASIFVKKSATTGTKTFGFYYNNNVGSPNNGMWNCVINLTNITATTTAGGTAGTGIPTILSTNIVDYGSGWYRVEVAFTTGSAAGNSGSEIGFESNGVVVDFLAWGAQVEQSSYATSYIPTTSASATRVADACSKTGISSLIGQTEGVLFVDFVFTAYDSQAKWIAFLGGGSYYIGLYTDGSSHFVAEVYDNAFSFLNQTFTFSVGTRYKLALAYKTNDFAFYVNGTQVATDNSGTVPATSQFSFEYNSTANNNTSRIYNQAILFKTRLTNAELASLTTI
jgi:hypothetical protein